MEYEFGQAARKVGKRSDSSKSADRRVPAKRVAIVSLKLVRERNFHYANRKVQSP